MIAKANMNIGFLNSILSKINAMRVKICTQKSFILPLITFVSCNWQSSHGSMRLIESFQKRAMKWITGYGKALQMENLTSLRLLPLPIFWQLSDLIVLSALCHDEDDVISLIDPICQCKKWIISKIQNRTGKLGENFTLITAKIANSMPEEIGFSLLLVFKKRTFLVYMVSAGGDFCAESFMYRNKFRYCPVFSLNATVSVRTSCSIQWCSEFRTPTLQYIHKRFSNFLYI